jgi:hypothetical protein
MAFERGIMRIISFSVLLCIMVFFCGCAGNKETPASTTSSLMETVPATTLPAPPASFGEYATSYTRMEYAGVLGGKPAYIVSKGNKKLILYDGKEIGGSYDQALMPALIEGKLFYAGVKNNKYNAVYDGQEIGKDYFSIWSPGEYNDKPIYIAEKIGKSVLIYDGNEISNASYDYVWSYSVINGKIAYIASKPGETYTAKKINPQTSESRRDIPPEGVKSVIIYDGKEAGREYDTVGFPMEINGKLAYIALKDGKKFSVFGNMEGTKYDEIGEPLLIKGKPAFIAQKDRKSLLVYDGLEMKSYDRIDIFSLKDADGKLCYRAADSSTKKGKYFIVYDGTEVGKDYDNVLSFAAFAGKQAYVADRKNVRSVVYAGGDTGKEYSTIDPESLAFYGGKLSFIAQKSNVWYVVSEE